MRRIPALALILLVALATPLPAVETYEIDPVHSTISFRIRHLAARTSGTFDEFGGILVVDRSDLSSAEVTVDIDCDSVNTMNEDRDRHLRSAEFFHVERFPSMSFRSTRFDPGVGGQGHLHGELTIRGITRPVVLRVELLDFGPDPWGGYRAGFAGSARVNRKDFGIIWNMAMDQGGWVLGDEVEIQVDIEAVRMGPEADTTGR